MRLDRLWIDGWRNLRNVEIDFDEKRLTTVVIGQNGTGKSNLLEAITEIFRNADLDLAPPRFSFELDYRIDDHKVRIAGIGGEWNLVGDGKPLSRSEFAKRKAELFPDLVFGYYSGGNNRLEWLFNIHQRRYYGKIIREDTEAEKRVAIEDRRLFYCRPIHGVLALLSFFAFPDEAINKLLEDMLGITGFHSAMVIFREPWFAKSTRRRTAPLDFWGAAGRPGYCARLLRNVAFFPLARKERQIDDYRDKGGDEQQLCIFLRNGDALRTFAANFTDDLEMFEALESVDISDLIRWVQVWVTRKDDATGDISFGDLSDGERQLLMVLGLIRLSRGKRALFLLDEPDTHLNPAWQHRYLELIRAWAQADAKRCQFIIATHHPLTIAALEKEEVRVMFSDETGKAAVSAPYTDPKGMGFTATLTEIFGLSTSLDPDTQRQVDERNILARIDKRTEQQDKQLIAINDRLNRLGFMFEDREPLYQDFLRAMHNVRYADRPPLSPEQIEKRHAAMKELMKGLLAKKEAAT